MSKHITGVDFDYQCQECGEWKLDSEFEQTGMSEICLECETQNG